MLSSVGLGLGLGLGQGLDLGLGVPNPRTRPGTGEGNEVVGDEVVGEGEAGEDKDEEEDDMLMCRSNYVVGHAGSMRCWRGDVGKVDDMKWGNISMEWVNGGGGSKTTTTYRESAQPAIIKRARIKSAVSTSHPSRSTSRMPEKE